MEHKSPEGLNSQLSSAEQALGSEFFPNDEKRAEVLDMDLESIKNKYPYRYEQYVKILKEAKGDGTSEQELISIRKYIALINNLESYIASYEKDRPEGFLREHQQDVFHSIAEFLNKGHKAGYLDLPTGFGKTVLFVELIKALSKGEEGNKNPLKTLVLVPTQDLVTQTIGRAVKKENLKGFAKFAPDIKVTAYYQNEKDLTGDVVVSTYKSFIALQKNNPKFADQFNLVIFDEAHKALGEVTKEQIKGIAPHSLKIGCTATSEYNSGRSVEDVLPELIHKIQPKEAIELGILANPRGFLYRTGIKIEGDSNELADYSVDVLRELNSAARNKITVDFVKTFVSKGIRGLVPCFPGDEGQHSIDMSDMIANEKIIDIKTKKERNIITRSITQDTDKGKREKIYEAFQNGEIDCITYIDVLTTGVDLPNAKFLVRCRPRKSKIQSVQEIGRLLRPYEGEDPYVVEIEDDFPLGEKPYTIFDMFEVTSIAQGEKLVNGKFRFPEQGIGLPTVPLDTEEVEVEKSEVDKDFTVGLDTETDFAEDIQEPKDGDIIPEKSFITSDYDNTSQRDRLEEEERKRELIRELLGKMSVEPVLIRELKINEEKKGEIAPEGWMTNKGLSNNLSVDFETIKRVANKYRTRKEWFNDYLGHNKTYEYYHPDLVAIITREITEKGEKAPEGWMIAYSLANELGVGLKKVIQIVEQYKDRNEWFKNYLDKANRLSNYYHPDLVAIITREITEKGEKAPEGWMRKNDLVKHLTVSDMTIKRITNKYRANKDWFKQYLDTKKRSFEYYHPDLVDIITKEVKSRPEKAPEGWMTKNGLADILGTHDVTLNSMANKYRANKEWFKKYLDKSGNTFEYYHPNLVDIITKEVKNKR